MKTSPGHPILRATAVVLIAAFGVGACSSQPSAKRVAQDLVNSINADNPDITDAQRECALGKVDQYSESELEKIGANAQSGDTAEKAAANAELDKLQAEIEACLK